MKKHVIHFVRAFGYSLAKKAKDCASAAVFCMSAALVVAWGCVIVWLV